MREYEEKEGGERDGGEEKEGRERDQKYDRKGIPFIINFVINADNDIEIKKKSSPVISRDLLNENMQIYANIFKIIRNWCRTDVSFERY